MSPAAAPPLCLPAKVALPALGAHRGRASPGGSPRGAGHVPQPGRDTSPDRTELRSSLGSSRGGRAAHSVLPSALPAAAAPQPRSPPPLLRSPGALPSALPFRLLPGPAGAGRLPGAPAGPRYQRYLSRCSRPPAPPPAPGAAEGRAQRGPGSASAKAGKGGRAPPEPHGSSRRRLVPRTLTDLRVGPAALSRALCDAATPGRPRPRRRGQHSPPAGPRRSPPRRAGLLRSASPPPPACLRQPLALR